MKLSELTYTDGAPEGGAKEGMAVRYSDGGVDDYAVVGSMGPAWSGGINDGGCGCCSENYRITGWCWLGPEIDED